jgi:hypothetical protein
MVGTKKKNGKEVPNCVPKNEEVEIYEAKVGDTVSFHHELKAAPGTKMKKSGTVEKVENDTVHVKVKDRYGVKRHQVKMSDLVKENFDADFLAMARQKNPNARLVTPEQKKKEAEELAKKRADLKPAHAAPTGNSRPLGGHDPKSNRSYSEEVEGVTEMDNRTPSGDRREKRNISGPEGLAALKKNAGLEEGLDPARRARLDDLISQYSDAVDPSDYGSYMDPDETIETIRQEFGDKIARQVKAGADKMHFPRDNHTMGSDPLSWKKGNNHRLTKAGKLFKQDNDYMKNTIKSRYKLSGKSATHRGEVNLPEEVEGVTEMDNRTPSGDRREKRNNSPEAIAQREKEQQKRLKSISPEMRKKLRLPEPKEGVAEGSLNESVIRSETIGPYTHELHKTPWGYQVRVYAGGKQVHSDITKPTEEKGQKSFDSNIAYTKKQLRIDEQGVAEDVEQVEEAVKRKLSGGSKVSHATHGKGTVHMVASGGGSMVPKDSAIVKFSSGKKTVKIKDLTIHEDVEQVDELNKDTVYSYNKKSTADTEKLHKKLGEFIRSNKPAEANKTAHKLNKRVAGQERADARLNTEEAALEEAKAKKEETPSKKDIVKGEKLSGKQEPVNVNPELKEK